jgi:hypothetical protein
MKTAFVSLLAMLIITGPVWADEAPAEIEYLLSTIGSSHCAFIRNGSRHSAPEAEEHLRMKYRRGKRYAPTAEAFIERLASKSSMSNKPYQIDCPDHAVVTSGEWLSLKLAEYRKRK